MALVVDNDRKPPAERLKQLHKGAEEAAVPIPVALGVAIEANEAWLLADEKALEKSLDLDKPIQRQQDPERIPDPKQHLNQLAERRVTGLELARIAEALDIEQLQKRCSKGFGRFAVEVRQKLGALLGQRSETETE